MLNLDAKDPSPAVAARTGRRRLVVQGIVQGVGFRPFVYGLARGFQLAGFVRNDSIGVTIEVEGDSVRLEGFTRALRGELPPFKMSPTTVKKPPCAFSPCARPAGKSITICSTGAFTRSPTPARSAGRG